MSFICPKCSGTNFGTRRNKPLGVSTGRCHDEHGKGCSYKWERTKENDAKVFHITEPKKRPVDARTIIEHAKEGQPRNEPERVAAMLGVFMLIAGVELPEFNKCLAWLHDGTEVDAKD